MSFPWIFPITLPGPSLLHAPMTASKATNNVRRAHLKPTSSTVLIRSRPEPNALPSVSGKPRPSPIRRWVMHVCLAECGSVSFLGLTRASVEELELASKPNVGDCVEVGVELEAIGPDPGDGSAGSRVEPAAELWADLETVYAEDFERLVGVARMILGGGDGAEEIVQEAFVRSLARWGHLDQRDAPRAYVRAAVVNLCRSRFRRRVLALRRPDPVPSAEVTVVEAKRRDDLLDAMARLPLRQREVVALRYLEGLSTIETAEALSIAPGTVKAHLHRGLAALREGLEAYGHD